MTESTKAYPRSIRHFAGGRMNASTQAMLHTALAELEAAHDAARAERVAEAIARTERAVRLLRCVEDLERIDAEERKRLEEARRYGLSTDADQCVECGRWGATGGICETCRHDAAAMKGLS